MDKHEPTQPDSGITPRRPAGDESGPPADPPEAELGAGDWVRQNWLMLVIIAAALVLGYTRLGPDAMVSIGKAALGLSLVIFVHELGHYLAAKWCGVYVQVFSIGFGPAVPGCHFKWGETYYKLAIFPFGGYVQMLGQVDVHEESDGSEDDPRSYRNKTVLQRMFIISAGVIMNTIMAIICFVVVFQGPGKERPSAVIATVDSGSPSFTHGIRTGAVIDRIDDVEDPNFEDLTAAVIFHYNSDLNIVFHRPQDKRKTTITLTPRKGSNDERPLMGVSPSFVPQFAEKRFVGSDLAVPAWPGSAAASAEPPFAFGDEIVATTDPSDPGGPVKPLPTDPRKPGSNQRDYFALARRMELLAGKPMVFQVERKEGNNTRSIAITVPPQFHKTLGTVMAMGEVTALREGSPAAAARMRKRDKDTQGDIIEQVEVREADGRITRFSESAAKQQVRGAMQLVGALLLPPEPQPVVLQYLLQNEVRSEVVLDPVRLPDQLRAWAKRLVAAGVTPKDRDAWQVTLKVRRNNPPEPGQFRQYENVTLNLNWENGWDFDHIEAFSKDSPQAIPELGLAYQVKTTVLSIDPRFAGEEGLKPEDVIQSIQYHSYADDKGTIKAGGWNKIEPNQWAHFFYLMQSPNVVKVSLKVNRDSNTIELTVPVEADTSWGNSDRGLILARDTRMQHAKDFFDAVALGLRDTYSNILKIFMVLRGMLTGGLSPSSIGGPVMIANYAYKYASIDFWEFIFFIGMISINLAVVNFLPIPVLDGGHMVFLLYELVRGKPASEQVRVGATYVGLLFIACLFLFVLYLDISRLFFW